MIYPNKLRKGDLIGLISPSSPVKPERIDECAAVLTAMGYRVKEGKGCRLRHHGYLAGPDEVRAADINEMFADPEVKGIFCVRGGNGSGRLMRMLDYDMIRENPKLFVGYSDVTNLLMAFYRLCGFVTLHGPMVSSNMIEHYDEYTRQSFEALLEMEEEYSFQNAPGTSIRTVVPGIAKGRLIGGNLSLISDMLGCFYAPDFSGNILFLEDVHESVANVDRMIGQLEHLGILNQISGLMLGDFSDCENSYDSAYDINTYIREELKDRSIPIVYGLTVGHCYPTGSLPMGAFCILDATQGKVHFIKK